MICEETLRQYLETPKTDYAVLLNGRWGSGKTYFVRNSMIPLAKELGLTPIYISLYGIQDINTVTRQILYSKLFAGQQWLGPAFIEPVIELIGAIPRAEKMLKAAGRAGGFFKQKTLEELNWSRNALFVDDLERMPESVDINELLGTIYSLFIDPDGAKVVFIANEEEVQSKWQTNYLRMREKVIRRIVSFSPDLRQVVESIVSDHCSNKPELMTFVQEHIDMLVGIYTKSGQTNLRYLGLALECFRNIFQCIGNESRYRERLRYLLAISLVLAIEFSGGGLTVEDENEIKDPYGAWLKWSVHNALSKPNKRPHKSRIVEICEKYGIDSSWGRYYCNSVFDSIVKGLFSRQKFLSELEESQRESPPEYATSLEKLWRFKELEQHTLETAVSQVLEYASAGLYELRLYPSIYKVMKEIAERRYIDNLPEDFFGTIERGVDAAAERTSNILELDEGDLSANSAEDDGYSQLVEKIRELKQEAEVRNAVAKIEHLLETMMSDDQAPFWTAIRHVNLRQLFSTLREHELFRKLFDFNNRAIWRMEYILTGELNGCATCQEGEAMKAIADHLREFVASSDELDRMRKQRFEDLIRLLNDIGNRAADKTSSP